MLDKQFEFKSPFLRISQTLRSIAKRSQTAGAGNWRLYHERMHRSLFTRKPHGLCESEESFQRCTSDGFIDLFKLVRSQRWTVAHSIVVENAALAIEQNVVWITF